MDSNHRKQKTSKNMTDLYLIRHPHTESNGFNLITSLGECELTTLGKRQIDAFVEAFRGKRIDALYSSDSLRARLLADAIGHSHGIPTRTDRRLREINMGIWESNFTANIIWEQPERYDCFINNSEAFRMEGFETADEIRERVMFAIQEIVERHPNATVAVVSHMGAIRSILSGAFRRPFTDESSVPSPENAGYIHLRCDHGVFERVEMENGILNEELKQMSAGKTLLRHEYADPKQYRDLFLSCCADNLLFRREKAQSCFEHAQKHYLSDKDSFVVLFDGRDPVGFIDFDAAKEKEKYRGWIACFCMEKKYRSESCIIQALGRACHKYRSMGRCELCFDVERDHEYIRGFIENYNAALHKGEEGSVPYVIKNLSGRKGNTATYVRMSVNDIPPDRRVIVMSDIHANLKYFDGLLQKVGFCDQDELVILGDFMEKGPDNLALLHRLMDMSKCGNVHLLAGNCENPSMFFFPNSQADETMLRYIRSGRSGGIAEMIRSLGEDPLTLTDFRSIRARLMEEYFEEYRFILSLPHVIETERYTFVHAGMIPGKPVTEQKLNDLVDFPMFLDKGYSFDKWVVVGHNPLYRYGKDRASVHPIVLPYRHIISIDGGCSLSPDGQLNAMILPDIDSEEFTFESYDELPTGIVLNDRKESEKSFYIHRDSGIAQVVKRMGDFTRCRHLLTGYEMDVPTGRLLDNYDLTDCLDCTDYELPLKKGDIVSIIETTSRGYYVKHNGVIGWYRSELELLA